jgi:hypothetical protein
MKAHDPAKYEQYLETRRAWTRRKYHGDKEYRAGVRAKAKARYEREKAEGYSRGMKWWQEQNPAKRMLMSAKGRAKKKGLAWDLRLEDIHVPTHCPVLGVMLSSTPGSHYDRDYSPSLDRIDNNLGYVRGNVIVVSHRANAIKRDASLEELRKIVAFYEPLEFGVVEEGESVGTPLDQITDQMEEQF